MHAPGLTHEPLAWMNGAWIPLAEAAVSVFDGGFMQGVTVAEQLRTFGGKLFQLERHLDRLERSLQIVGIDSGLSRAALADIAQQLVRHNHGLLDPADDVGLTIFVTPGTYGAYAASGAQRGPTVCLHAQPLAFAHWAKKYATGDALVVSDVRQVPVDCWPPELKCRSRMHYYLADKQAREREPGARALLLDHRGMVTEASTANVLAYFMGEGLVSPPKEHILPGVSVAVIEDLAGQLAMPFHHREMRIEDAARADELLLCSTSPCVWSATRLNGAPIGTGAPGPVAERLRAAWSQMVGLDIEAQARRFAVRP